MKADDIRRHFLDYFRARGHELLPSGPLVPPDDPTLLFTNAGMVQFKKVFLGLEEVPYDRAVTSQKCVRAGGKHNDLEEVGRTTRHHTFFEMLGNFSFGDYFKRDAIHFAWELLTDEFGLDPERFYATVHHSDAEAAALWREVAGLEASRIHRLGDEDNFWQMADTGPCGPCSELHYDLRPERERSGGPPATAEFERLGEEGVILELWNLVFMQFDRDEEGTLTPLPAPSIDTGAGLERLAAVLQGADSNYHTDLFLPLLDRAGSVVGRPYEAGSSSGLSYRVLADHARAVAFLLADGVFPSSDGRGYVVRRILRRAVRHAWLLDRREPTLVEVVDEVIERMGDVFPELGEGREAILRTTRQEEERFLATIEGGLERFDAVAPPLGDETSEPPPSIPGEEVFQLYDTHGFPLDLTRLMAEERGYRVDTEGFESALERQRSRSRADHAARDLRVTEISAETWTTLADEEQEFVGYDRTEVDTEVLAFWREDGRMAVQLRENPFYQEAGGQVSDRGEVRGDGWHLRVEDVLRTGDRAALLGSLVDGELPDSPGTPLRARARVDREARHDTERNHTATHLLHAALREILGPHVVQRGSLVAPDRLRFDFSHGAPLTGEEIESLEEWVNRRIWEDHVLETEIRTHEEAMAEGAIGLFGEKYGDRVRVVRIPGVSVELCGGTHVRHTGEAGIFRIVRESGVAAGVRRIEAVTARAAYRLMREGERRLQEVADRVRATPENLEVRIEQLLREKAQLEEHLQELRRAGGTGERVIRESTLEGEEGREIGYRGVRLRARSPDEVRELGDRFRGDARRGVLVVGAELPEEKWTLFVFVTDDLVEGELRANELIGPIARAADGRGGGRPHMAQAGVGDPTKLEQALREGEDVVRRALAGGAVT